MFWRPILSVDIQIYLFAKGFFIVKFENAEDRKTILCDYSFSWEERFPLMIKLWHKDLDPLTKYFNKIPVWVRLPNLPLHLWLDSILVSIGDALGDFQIVDFVTSNFMHSMVACILVELDVFKGLPEKIFLDSP